MDPPFAQAATARRSPSNVRGDGGVNLSGISQRTSVGWLLRLPLRLIPSNARLPILQGKLRGTRWIAGAGTHGCWIGSYEYESRRLFEKTVRPGMTVFDLGAHSGFYTLLASKMVGSGGRVIAFEPSPRNLSYLHRHLEINRIENVTVIEAAVSDTSGRQSFDAGAESELGHLSDEGDLEVETVALDELAHSGQVPPPDVVKMDIEGHEHLALLGAREMLTDRRPVLWISTHGKEVHEQCCRFLEALGYRLEPIGTEILDEASEFIAAPR